MEIFTGCSSLSRVGRDVGAGAPSPAFLRQAVIATLYQCVRPRYRQAASAAAEHAVSYLIDGGYMWRKSPDSWTTHPMSGARRCGAANRDGGRCMAFAVRGKTRCRNHGGLSTGRKTKPTLSPEDIREAHAGRRAWLADLKARGEPTPYAAPRKLIQTQRELSRQEGRRGRSKATGEGLQGRETHGRGGGRQDGGKGAPGARDR